VPLRGAGVDLLEGAGTGPDVRFLDHPANAAMTVGENLVADTVHVRKYLPLASDWEPDDGLRDDGVQTIAALRDGSPLAFASSLGAGRILTVLTTLDTDWTDWPRTIAFPLFHVPAQEWAARSETGDGVANAGEPLTFSLDPARFRPDILIERPDELSATLTATPRTEEDDGNATEEPTDPAGDAADGDSAGGDAAEEAPADLRLTARYADTDLQGVYRARLTTADGGPVDRWTSLNFPPDESRLGLIAPDALTAALSGTENVTIQEAGDASWTGGGEQTREIRWWLLGLMAALMAAESLLAYRCGYHGAGA
jgi:hypothetical protein